MLRVPADALRDRANALFPFGGHLIARLYHTARSIESTARQRKSLVTLGTLAAGIAHEINNPASAASRAARPSKRSARRCCRRFVCSMEGHITSEQFAALDRLRSEIKPGIAELDPLARADQRAGARFLAAPSRYERGSGPSRHSSPQPELIVSGASGLQPHSTNRPSSRVWNGSRAR